MLVMAYHVKMKKKKKEEFARSQLEKYGWCEGKGLGKQENGISKAIKVNIKTDSAGVGFDAGDQFSFHWWDHVFNKAAKSIEIQESEEGVEVRKSSKTSCDVSNKRPNKNGGKPLLYGRFVKASFQSQSIVGEDSDEDSDKEKDFSNFFSDEELFQACGGRTAHKAARHGLGLNGKLQRVEAQERLEITQSSKNGASGCVLYDDMESLIDEKECEQKWKETKKCEKTRKKGNERRKRKRKDGDEAENENEDRKGKDPCDVEKRSRKKKEKRKKKNC
ncbi:G patch domain-containing protein 4-like isoform X1 [Acropora muricata]|uniref:G patch domain-containing protein 4-like isoform X1 n=1 Tax=Acropora muricata TaxID=159855 RepID=UPI0034E3BC18